MSPGNVMTAKALLFAGAVIVSYATMLLLFQTIFLMTISITTCPRDYVLIGEVACAPPGAECPYANVTFVTATVNPKFVYEICMNFTGVVAGIVIVNSLVYLSKNSAAGTTTTTTPLLDEQRDDHI